MAAAFLETRGVKILEKNYRCRQGEIDLVARDEGYLVFVEVKYRSSRDKGAPEAAVGLQKQRKICAVADYYRLTHGLGDGTAVRYDVLAMEGREISWIRNAFPHHYRHG